jgi:hypothetical protein
LLKLYAENGTRIERRRPLSAVSVPVFSPVRVNGPRTPGRLLHMDVQGIDPRHDPRWETEPSRDYRVIFWTTSRAPEGTAQEQVGWSADENDVSGAQDVHEVIHWAEREARERGAVYTLYAKVDRGDEHGLVWLAGLDPTISTGDNFGRYAPVGVPVVLHPWR